MIDEIHISSQITGEYRCDIHYSINTKDIATRFSLPEDTAEKVLHAFVAESQYSKEIAFEGAINRVLKMLIEELYKQDPVLCLRDSTFKKMDCSKNLI
jgi:hypothetical protein